MPKSKEKKAEEVKLETVARKKPEREMAQFRQSIGEGDYGDLKFRIAIGVNTADICVDVTSKDGETTYYSIPTNELVKSLLATIKQ